MADKLLVRFPKLPMIFGSGYFARLDDERTANLSQASVFAKTVRPDEAGKIAARYSGGRNEA
jgi:hypothetical protein